MEKSSSNRIGCYVTDKKSQKINWTEFESICRTYGFSLVKLDLTLPLEDQGPFFAIVHKCTDLIVKSSLGDAKAKSMLESFESYMKQNPQTIVLDPLESVRGFMNRSTCYSSIQNSDLVEDMVFTPTFVDLYSDNVNENIKTLKEAGVTFPFVCKPSYSHGSKAHQMALIFNEKGVADCRPPCVAQSFINHNAVLYKVFVLGNEYYMTRRPSIKNYYPKDQDTIFFISSDVSSANSKSSLTVLDPEEGSSIHTIEPDINRVNHIVSTLHTKLDMAVFGVDFVIEQSSGRYGIIDFNIFPSYDGFPNLFDSLVKYITIKASKLEESVHPVKCKNTDSLGVSNTTASEQMNEALDTEFKHEKGENVKSQLIQSPTLGSAPCDHDDSGFDTGDSSDERKKKMGRARGSQGRKVAALRNAASRSNFTLNGQTDRDEGLGET